MEPMKKTRGGKQEENIIQDRICRKLKGLDWFVKESHGDMYSSGWPDVFCYHQMYGMRWVEVKNPKGYRFTNAQTLWFPKFAAVGCGIWILTSDSDEEIKKLFGPANWHLYLSTWSLHGRGINNR
jgi:hypothetical protein